MLDSSHVRPASRYDLGAWIVTALLLLLVLLFKLLPALIAGLLVYELVHVLARRVTARKISRELRKIVAVALIATLVVTLLTFAIAGLIAFFRSDAGSLPRLLDQMADTIDSSRSHLPAWLEQRLPENATQLRATLTTWLREHSGDLRTIGAETVRAFVHILIGMVIGAMVSLNEARRSNEVRPFTRALTERVWRLGNAFRNIVFAQVRISALNTTLTALYLAVFLPFIGIHLPLTKTMIAITFIVGLMPVIGNLISNTVIFIVSLSHSLLAAIGSLAYLIVIHKLEYFVNARIMGGQIKARAWELLTAMMLMEAIFGIAGVIAAPIFYAYINDELASRGLIGSTAPSHEPTA